MDNDLEEKQSYDMNWKFDYLGEWPGDIKSIINRREKEIEKFGKKSFNRFGKYFEMERCITLSDFGLIYLPDKLFDIVKEIDVESWNNTNINIKHLLFGLLGMFYEMGHEIHKTEIEKESLIKTSKELLKEKDQLQMELQSFKRITEKNQDIQLKVKQRLHWLRMKNQSSTNGMICQKNIKWINWNKCPGKCQMINNYNLPVASTEEESMEWIIESKSIEKQIKRWKLLYKDEQYMNGMEKNIHKCLVDHGLEMAANMYQMERFIMYEERCMKRECAPFSDWGIDSVLYN